MHPLVNENTEAHCPGCGVKIGQAHRRGCEVEACNVCYERYYVECECRGKGRKLSPWTGEEPFVAECREFGWFSVRAERGSKPCVVGTPGAIHDISRWQLYKATGRDDYLDGKAACPGCGNVVCNCLRPVPTYQTTVEYSSQDRPGIWDGGPCSWAEFSERVEDAMTRKLRSDLRFTMTYPNGLSTTFVLTVENPYIGDGVRPTESWANPNG